MSDDRPKFTAFISYASADLAKAQEVLDRLESQGHNCWMAPRNIRAGHEYGDEIIHGIEHSGCLVLILSQSANQSAFVHREVERAVSKGKPIFPLRMEEVMPCPALELFVSSSHWIDAWRGKLNDHVDQLAAGLSDQTTPPPSAAYSTAGPPAQKSGIPGWIYPAGIVAVIAVVVVIAVMMKGNHAAPAPIASTPTTTALPNSVPPAPVVPAAVVPAAPVPVVPARVTPIVPRPVPGVVSPYKPLRSAELTSTAAPAGLSAPTVYEDYRSATAVLAFTVVCPPDTALVRYAFDGGAFFEVPGPRGNPRIPLPVTFFEWPAGSSLRLMFRDSANNDTGPFDYTLPDAKATVISDLKTEFIAAAPTAIRCYAVQFDWPVTDVDWPTVKSQIAATDPTDRPPMMQAAQLQHRQFTYRTNSLKQLDCGFVTQAPIVACVGVRGTPAALWAVVQSIQIGATPDDFPVTAKVNIDWEAFFKQGKDYFAASPDVYSGADTQPRVLKPSAIWNATMPPDSKSLCMRFVFQDGTTSDAFRYRVDTSRFHQ